MRLGDIVAILWRDSVAPVHDAWIRSSDLSDELPTLVTVGAVVKLSRRSVTLASSFNLSMDDDDEQLGGVMQIPRSAIIEVRDLEWTERG